MSMKTILALLACAFINQAVAANDPRNSPYYVIPSKTVIVLNQSLRIPPDTAGVYMQYGEVKAENQVDFYYANCRLEVNDVRETHQTVEPDRFIVTRVQLFEDYSSRPVQVAALAGFFMGDGPTPQDYATVMHLRSEKQPFVRQLVCKHLEDPALIPEHLTVKQMQAALGRIMTIELRD